MGRNGTTLCEHAQVSSHDTGVAKEKTPGVGSLANGLFGVTRRSATGTLRLFR